MVSGEDKDKDKYNDKYKYNDKDNERVWDALSLFSPQGGYIYIFSLGKERKKLPPLYG